MFQNYIQVRGAEENNLKCISCDIPRNALVLITGPSGSGKSSLLIRTIYREAQRRFIAPYLRLKRGRFGRPAAPRVLSITGLSFAASVTNTPPGRGLATCATGGGLFEPLQALFASFGRLHCPGCGAQVKVLSSRELLKLAASFPQQSEIYVQIPVESRSLSDAQSVKEHYLSLGFTRALVENEVFRLEQVAQGLPEQGGKWAVLVDLVSMRGDWERRLLESVELARSAGAGEVSLLVRGDGGFEEYAASEKPRCQSCGRRVSTAEANSFSYYRPGACCSACGGAGALWSFDEDLLVADSSAPLLKGAIAPWQRRALRPSAAELGSLLEENGFSREVSYDKLSGPQKKRLLYGRLGDNRLRIFSAVKESREGDDFVNGGIAGVLRAKYRRTASRGLKTFIEDLVRETPCPACSETRVNPDAASVRLAGRSFGEMFCGTILDAWQWACGKGFVELFGGGPQDERRRASYDEAGSAALVLKQSAAEFRERLQMLIELGVGYLELNRELSTLSSGEMQRVSLVNELASRTEGLLYLLDEPTIGLHPRDSLALRSALCGLVSRGGSVLAADNDPSLLSNCDWIIELGPGAGPAGGRIVAEGLPADVARGETAAGALLSAQAAPELLSEQLAADEGRFSKTGCLLLKGASKHNLKGLDARFPLGKLTAVVGLSGSGKSTLVMDCLSKGVESCLRQRKSEVVHETGLVKLGMESISGVEGIFRIVDCGASRLPQGDRSLVATASGLFTHIRMLYARTIEAQIRGLKAADFSLQNPQSTCALCKGRGEARVDLGDLPSVYVICQMCAGSRFIPEIERVKFKGISLGEVLRMTVGEMSEHFGRIRGLRERLQFLKDVGLEYLKLGQPVSQLSSGERQRLRLASVLKAHPRGRTLYLFDEPTQGLHPQEIGLLASVLRGLTERGDTVVFIEHDNMLIREADYLIELGPGAGPEGGKIVREGWRADTEI